MPRSILYSLFERILTLIGLRPRGGQARELRDRPLLSTARIDGDRASTEEKARSAEMFELFRRCEYPGDRTY